MFNVIGAWIDEVYWLTRNIFVNHPLIMWGSPEHRGWLVKAFDSVTTSTSYCNWSPFQALSLNRQELVPHNNTCYSTMKTINLLGIERCEKLQLITKIIISKITPQNNINSSICVCLIWFNNWISGLKLFKTRNIS